MQLVLDLPTPEGIRVVIVDDENSVNACLAMVLARFGALITSGPSTRVSEMIDVATPHARLSEIAADEGEAFAAVQKLCAPDGNYTVELMTFGPKAYLGPGRVGQSGAVSFEIFLTDSAAAVALALSLADLDPLSN